MNECTEINESNAAEVLTKLINVRASTGQGWDALSILVGLVGEDDFNDTEILAEVGMLKTPT